MYGFSNFAIHLSALHDLTKISTKSLGVERLGAMRERITEVDVHYPPIKAKPERSERIGGGSAA